MHGLDKELGFLTGASILKTEKYSNRSLKTVFINDSEKSSKVISLLFSRQSEILSSFLNASIFSMTVFLSLDENTLRFTLPFLSV